MQTITAALFALMLSGAATGYIESRALINFTTRTEQNHLPLPQIQKECFGARLRDAIVLPSPLSDGAVLYSLRVPLPPLPPPPPLCSPVGNNGQQLCLLTVHPPCWSEPRKDNALGSIPNETLLFKT